MGMDQCLGIVCVCCMCINGMNLRGYALVFVVFLFFLCD